MKAQKKIFFKKEDNVIKELLDCNTMHNIIGGLETDYSKFVYSETTYTRMKPKINP